MTTTISRTPNKRTKKAQLRAEFELYEQGYIKAFVQALHELGWAHGRNVQIEYRWGGGNLDRIRTYAAELVGLKPDVVLAQTALAVAPLQRETRTVPIVFMQLVDPVESGFVASLARPGGRARPGIFFELCPRKWASVRPHSIIGDSRRVPMTSKERTSLTQNAEAHIKALTAVIDRLTEMRATEELKSIARQLSQLSLKASPSSPPSP